MIFLYIWYILIRQKMIFYACRTFFYVFWAFLCTILYAILSVLDGIATFALGANDCEYRPKKGKPQFVISHCLSNHAVWPKEFKWFACCECLFWFGWFVCFSRVISCCLVVLFVLHFVVLLFSFFFFSFFLFSFPLAHAMNAWQWVERRMSHVVFRCFLVSFMCLQLFSGVWGSFKSSAVWPSETCILWFHY